MEHRMYAWCRDTLVSLQESEKENCSKLIMSKPGRFCIFFNNTIHYTIFQGIGPIQYKTNTIQYLKELYPIRNNILIHLIKKIC